MSGVARWSARSHVLKLLVGGMEGLTHNHNGGLHLEEGLNAVPEKLLNISERSNIPRSSGTARGRVMTSEIGGFACLFGDLKKYWHLVNPQLAGGSSLENGWRKCFDGYPMVGLREGQNTRASRAP